MVTRKPKNGKQFTVQELDNLPAEWEGDKLSDGGGLRGTVRVNRSRVKQNSKPEIKVSWEYSMRVNRKQVWFNCGLYPNVGLSEIRAKRDWAKQVVRQGLDPRDVIKAELVKKAEAQREVFQREETRKAEALRVSDLFNRWVVEGVNRKDSNKSIKAMFKNHLLPVVGKVALKDLSEQDLIGVYKKLLADGKVKTMIELHKDVGQMLRWAGERKPYRKLLIEGNPAVLVDMNTLVPRGYKKERDRVLSESEITSLYEKFKDSPIKETIQIAVWLCLSCTCRIGELTLAEWSHVDFEAKTWFIPAENSKGQEKRKTNHTIFLSDFALRQFTRLKELVGDNRWCFPATNTGGSVGKASMSKAVGDRQIQFMNRTRKLQNRVENNSLVIGDGVWTMHDLRTTSATLIQQLYPSVQDGELIAQLCLHHQVVGGAARHYLFHKYEPQMREAWGLLGKRLDLLTFNQSANVVTFNHPLKA